MLQSRAFSFLFQQAYTTKNNFSFSKKKAKAQTARASMPEYFQDAAKQQNEILFVISFHEQHSEFHSSLDSLCTSLMPV